MFLCSKIFAYYLLEKSFFSKSGHDFFRFLPPNFSVSVNPFKQHNFLNHRIGLPSDRSRIDYNDFLRAFEDGRKSSYGRQPVDIRLEEFQKLSPEEAEKKLRSRVERNIDDIMKVN